MEQLFRFKETADGVAVTEYIGPGEITEPEIPAEIDGKPVTEIAGYAFFENGAGLRRIVLPDSVLRIRPHAFELCVELRELVLNEGLLEIGENFLAGTSVEELVLPSSVKTVRQPETLPCRVIAAQDNAEYSSDDCGLYRGTCLVSVNPNDLRKCYEIREGTTEIGRGVFDERNALEKVVLPASLEHAAGGVFANIKNLYERERGIREVVPAPGQERFFAEGGGLYERRDGELVLHRWFGEEREIRLREDLTEIGREAFLRCRNLTAVTAGPSLAKIGKNAFAGCPLQEVHFSGGHFTVRFPAENNYLLKDLLEGFGRNGKLYDFTAYDRKVRVWYSDISRVSMMTARLRDPRDLSEEDAALFTDILRDHLDEVTELIAAQDAMRELTDLTELGFFDAESSRRAINVFGRAGRADLAAEVMAYYNTHFQSMEADYTL